MARKSVTGVTSNPDFAERGLGQEPQTLGTFRVARVDDEGNEEERKKSYTATRTECNPPPPNPPKFSRGSMFIYFPNHWRAKQPSAARLRNRKRASWAVSFSRTIFHGSICLSSVSIPLWIERKTRRILRCTLSERKVMMTSLQRWTKG